MADFTGAQYTVDEVLAGIKKNQITGLPPSKPDSKSVRIGDGKAHRLERSATTTVDGQELQLPAAFDPRALGEAPASITDGDLELVTSDLSGASRTLAWRTTDLHLALFPFSDHASTISPRRTSSARPLAPTSSTLRDHKANSDPESCVTYTDWPLASPPPREFVPGASTPAAGPRRVLRQNEPRLDGKERRHS
jgi:hypothetical protein